MSDTIEVQQEQFEEFMSVLDGILDSIYDNGYGEQVRRLDDLREAMRVEQADLDGAELKSRGQLVFDNLTEDTFENLVEQSLNESDFIYVKNGIIYEVADSETQRNSRRSGSESAEVYDDE